MMVLKVLMILKDIELLCKGSNSVYWLVETTAAIKSEYRKILSDFFQVMSIVFYIFMSVIR